ALVRLGVDHVGVLIGEGAFPRELSAERATEIFAAVPAGKKGGGLSLSPGAGGSGRGVGRTPPAIAHNEAALASFSAAPTRGRRYAGAQSRVSAGADHEVDPSRRRHQH